MKVVFYDVDDVLYITLFILCILHQVMYLMHNASFNDGYEKDLGVDQSMGD